MLKPHGSLDWQVCIKCNKLHFKFPSTHWDDFGRTKCSNAQCDGLLWPHIFMPHIDYPNGMNKSDTSIDLLNQSLEESLMNAEKITVVGYSFPEYDEHLRNMLTKTKGSKTLREIEVVDFEADTNKWEERQKSIQEKYRTMVGNPDIIKVCLCGFGYWINEQLSRI